MPRTQAEVDAHNARVAAGRARRQGGAQIPSGASKPLESASAEAKPASWEGKESDLHHLIGQEIARRGWLAFRGSMAVATARNLGEPDFLCVAPGRVFWVEVKNSKGKLTREQEGMIHWLRRLGHQAEVVRSFEEFLAVADGAPATPAHVRD